MHGVQYLMIDQTIHLYEKISLFDAGLLMALALVIGHLVALLYPRQTVGLMKSLCYAERWGQVLFTLDFIWIILLLWDAPWNPLRMELFDFNFARKFLLILSPIMWYTLCFHAKRNLFGRALGLFLLLLGIVPLTAAFLKEPDTRILIPLWWYPVLTFAIFLVPMPYLLRDCVDWLAQRLRLLRVLAAAGLAYGVLMLVCAILYWS